ncbi:hypothetical protein DFH06DRAFT_162471 [Mycena polygramma]|nr:hypothetical protein DFH06DRAFT_162471 [Mycena polygramma]
MAGPEGYFPHFSNDPDYSCIFVCDELPHLTLPHHLTRLSHLQYSMSTSLLPAYFPGDQLLMDGLPPAGPERDDVIFGADYYDVNTVDVSLDSYAGLTPDLIENLLEALGTTCGSNGDALQSASTPIEVFTAVDGPVSAEEDYGSDEDGAFVYDSECETEGEAECVVAPASLPARPLCPLPGRAIPKCALSSACRAARAAPTPSPVVVSQSPPQAPTVPTDAAAPASSEHEPAASKKRKAQRAAGPRANKRAALEPDNMKSIPNIPGITDAHLPPVPGFDHIALRFHGQLRLGCTPVSGDKMQCCDCSKSAAFADMWRHLECVHGYGEVPCEGCPQTFSRGDSLLRHTRARGKSHFSAARKSAVPKFNALQEVIKLRAERPRGEKSTSKEKLEFNKMINAKFTTWFATGVFV